MGSCASQQTVVESPAPAKNGESEKSKQAQAVLKTPENEQDAPSLATATSSSTAIKEKAQLPQKEVTGDLGYEPDLDENIMVSPAGYELFFSDARFLFSVVCRLFE
jgi:hypothetical protein